MARTQLPAWSPLSAGVIARGLQAWWAGDAVAKLEAALRLEFGAREILLTDSGTTALTLAIRSLGPRARIGVPAYGCFDLATAALGAGALVRCYDLDPATLGPDDASLRGVLETGVDAVVFAHLYGIPMPVPEWRALAHDRGALVVDDAAQGVGGSIDGVPLGGLGDLGVLSFGRGKGRTGGHGGALLATTPLGAECLGKLDRATLHAPGGQLTDLVKLAAQWALGRPSLYAIPSAVPWLRLGETRFRDPEPAGRIGGLAAGVVLAGSEAVRRESEARKVEADRWRGLMAGIEGVRPIAVGPHRQAGWLRFPIIVPRQWRHRLLGPAVRRLGVMPGYPEALPRLERLKERLMAPAARSAGAEELAQALFTLPTHRWVRPGDREAVAELLQSLARFRLTDRGIPAENRVDPPHCLNW